MTPELSKALALIAAAQKDGDDTPSDVLEAAREAIDLVAARTAIELLEGSRGKLLVSAATDREIDVVNASIRTAQLDLERAEAASKALLELIVEAQKREQAAAIERMGADAKRIQHELFAAYGDIDDAALAVIDLQSRIVAGEAWLNEANRKFREAGRSNLMRGLPMMELARLAKCDGQFLPRLDLWSIHGYSTTAAGQLGDADGQPVHPSRRFGRLRELLPDTPPSRKAA